MEVIDRLIEYWVSEGVVIQENSVEKIEAVIRNKNISIPIDFKDFYKRANGMVNLFPNDYDREGFLFYPIEDIITMENEFDDTININLKDVIIFADYLLKCWWYGVKVMEDGSYRIGIISDKNTFNFVTGSLNEFIELYLKDSELIY